MVQRHLFYLSVTETKSLLKKSLIKNKWTKNTPSLSIQTAVTKYQPGMLINNRNVFLRVLEAGSPRPRCQVGQVLVNNFFPFTDHLALSSPGGSSELVHWFLLLRALTLIPRSPPANAFTLRDGFQYMNLGVENIPKLSVSDTHITVHFWAGRHASLMTQVSAHIQNWNR